MGMKVTKCWLYQVVCAAYACIMQQKQTASMSGNYKTMTVTASDITLDHEYTAKLEGEQAVEIRPQVSGTITKICVDEGAHVSKGRHSLSSTRWHIRLRYRLLRHRWTVPRVSGQL